MTSISKIIFSILAVITAMGSIPIQLSAAETVCSDITVIFARGSGESLNDKNYQAFSGQLHSAFQQYAPALKVNYHDLDYPAVGANNFSEAITTVITAGEAFDFNDSVKTGQSKLKSLINQINAACPATKFVLAGYSQGAMVISKSLPDLKSSQIIYAATFGDPKLYLPEGIGINPDACHGKNLSNYRQTVPDCHTDQGILTALSNYQPVGYKDKLGAWCNAGDFMCGSYIDWFGGVMKAHTSYATNDAYQEASSIILSSAKKYFPQVVSEQITPNYSQHDIAILIDETISMQNVIGTYRREAARLASQTIEQGGRVALYTYGDLRQRTARQICDFTTDLTTFQTALNTVQPSGGDDPEESALSALLHTMNTLKWHKGANKAIVLLTDASYHNPDLDGTTLPQIVQRSLEIDPVNIFVVTEPYATSWYQQLVTNTAGTVVSRAEIDTTISQVLERPHLTLNQEFYSAAAHQPINFSVSTKSNIAYYEWDLDGDGQFEIITTIPTVSHTYTQPFNSYIQVKAVADSGYFSTAAAPVHVVESTTPSIDNLTATIKGSTAELHFTTASTTTTLILINDVPFGFYQSNSITVRDIFSPTQIKLIPVDISGQRGKAVTTTITPDNFTPTTPRTGVR